MLANLKNNLTGTAMFETEWTEHRKKFCCKSTYCASQVPAGYFCRYENGR